MKWLSETRMPPPRVYHAKYFDLATAISHSKECSLRMSDENKQNGWSARCNDISLKRIARQFEYLCQKAKPLPWRVF